MIAKNSGWGMARNGEKIAAGGNPEQQKGAPVLKKNWIKKQTVLKIAVFTLANGGA